MRSRSLPWIFLVFVFLPDLAFAEECPVTVPGGMYRTGKPEGQSNFVVFPTAGCWEIVASVGQQSLTFVVAVELIDSGPAGRLNGVPQGWRQTGG
jgi:hypothetical protein